MTKGNIQSNQLSVIPVLRNNVTQVQCDSAIAPNNLACVAYTEFNGSTMAYKYVIIDYNTGQNIVAPTLLPPGAGAISGSPRVFLLGSYFVIAYTTLVSATHHLRYISVRVRLILQHQTSHVDIVCFVRSL